MEHVHDCPTEGCNGYFECSLDGCTGEQDRPCYVCMERERNEALNRCEVLEWLSDQMAHSAGLSARRMEQAQQARNEALKERDEARAEVERLKSGRDYDAKVIPDLVRELEETKLLLSVKMGTVEAQRQLLADNGVLLREARAETARLKEHLRHIAYEHCDSPVHYAMNQLED